jgi:FkbM family methyltransferase
MINKDKIWTIDKNGELLERNLSLENENFTIEDYRMGKFDSYNYIWFEMFNHYIHDDIGCDYERYGCYIRPGDVVLDLGANIGIFSRRAEERGASRVISFEPISTTFQCLLLNKGPKTEVHNVGVASVNEFRKFVIHTEVSNLGGAKYDPENTLSGFNIVYEKDSFVIDINQIFSQYRNINFVKMDIEGSEVEVLNSITDENLSSIRCLSAEFHRNSEDFEDFQKSFILRLENLGFNHFVLYHGDGSTRTLNSWKKN